MPEEKPLKPIIKRPSLEFKTHDQKKGSGRTLAGSKGSRKPGYFQLGVPAFFGGGQKHGGSNHSKLSSLANIGSIHSIDHARPGQRVHFLDHLSVRSISAIFIPSAESAQEPVDDGDKERILQLRDIQEDPNYLPGFVDLYYSRDITITEDTCCCITHTHYEITDNSSGKIIYSLEKDSDGCFSSFLKFCCFRNHHITRIGFNIRVFNTTVSHTKLLSFRRKTHWFAEQLDIVETYYSIENAHVGRIEKTVDGYRLVDQRGKETHQIFRDKTTDSKCSVKQGTLVVFCCDNRKIVAKMIYLKRTFCGSMWSFFMKPLKHQIQWYSDIAVSSKTLLLGVLLLELHSVEKFVDLPLGRDANIIVTTAKHHRRLSSLT